jgi:hypothetical protein
VRWFFEVVILLVTLGLALVTIFVSSGEGGSGWRRRLSTREKLLLAGQVLMFLLSLGRLYANAGNPGCDQVIADQVRNDVKRQLEQLEKNLKHWMENQVTESGSGGPRRSS